TGKKVDLPRLSTGRTAPPNESPSPGASTPIAALSPDGSILAGSIDGQTMIWDLGSGKILRKWAGSAVCMDFSSDGKRLATCDGLVQVWDVATGRQLLPDYGPRLEGGGDFNSSQVFSNIASSTIATWSEGSGKLRVWDIPTGRLRRSFDLFPYK